MRKKNIFHLCFIQIVNVALLFSDSSSLEKGSFENSNLNASVENLYINLIRNVLANTIYEDPPLFIGGNFDSYKRDNGLDCPSQAHTMIGIKRLNNIHYCIRSIIDENVLGDLIELGVWRGGSTIFMRAVLKAYGNTSRKVWVADLFPNINSGFPPHAIVSADSVRNNFRKYDLLDDQVVFLEGDVKDTLPSILIEEISLLRLDTNSYETTRFELEMLYPKVSLGGYVIIDDYGCYNECRRAVDEYRKKMNITNPLVTIDWTGVYWKKQ